MTASDFTIDQPAFYYGNPQMVSAEILKRMEIGTLKWPYIWAVEVSTADNTTDPSRAVKTTKRFNLFFLDSADKGNWTIEQHYDQDIYPLTNYLGYFIQVLKSRRDLFESDAITYSSSDHVNLGSIVTGKR